MQIKSGEFFTIIWGLHNTQRSINTILKHIEDRYKKHIDIELSIKISFYKTHIHTHLHKQLKNNLKNLAENKNLKKAVNISTTKHNINTFTVKNRNVVCC